MSYSCTVLIPIRYPEEHVFLKRNLLQIDKFKHPEVEVEVLIADQTVGRAVENCRAELSLPYVTSFICEGIDAGHPIDEGLKRASGNFFMSLDVDCAPIHRAWAYLPIKLIDKHNICAVGKQTALHMADSYKVLGDFVAINNYYRTMKTSTAKYVSESIGFCRPENRFRAGLIPTKNYGWVVPADNGVYANAFMDQEKLGSKVSLALNKINGMTNKMGVFGMVIDDLVWHMVFSSSKDWIADKWDTLGQDYMKWYQRIYDNGFTDEIFQEMQDALKDHHQALYDREIYENGILRRLTPQDEIFRDIVEIKNE